MTIGESRPGEMIVLKDETGFAGKEIEREMLNSIIHCRVRETLEVLRSQLDEAGISLEYLGAGLMLTGAVVPRLRQQAVDWSANRKAKPSRSFFTFLSIRLMLQLCQPVSTKGNHKRVAMATSWFRPMTTSVEF